MEKIDLTEIYNEVILENSRDKENKRKIEGISKKGINVSCGDELDIYVLIDKDKENNISGDSILKDISFTGESCAISEASANVMANLLKGKKIKEAINLIEMFLDMVKGKKQDIKELEELKDAIAFYNISKMPARSKCATLSWQTLKDMLSEIINKII